VRRAADGVEAISEMPNSSGSCAENGGHHRAAQLEPCGVCPLGGTRRMTVACEGGC
jgi:hypothetical protein